MTDIPANIATVRHRIQQATLKSLRNVTDICLLAVSKTHPADDIRRAYQAGLRHFGENYPQELEFKAAELRYPDLVWHFIGPLQANKTRLIAESCHWLHSLDRLKVAQRLNEQRPPALPPLNVCVQINIDNEASKSGLPLAAVADFVAQLVPLPQLAVRGIMVIPQADQPPAVTQASFARAAECLRELQEHFPLLNLDTLSMGMSGDLELAIAAGSTIVRVGSDIFGARAPKVS
jgi:pyridoxal phosphate enzyme (YggS family)